MESGARVVVDRVSKSYREGDKLHSVLRDASATIEPGEFLALLGPSGSGKSTLLNLISGIDSPDAGRVVVDDRDVTGLREPALTLFRRNRVGLVFQFFNLLPTLTVRENLLMPLELTGGLSAERRMRADDLLDRVGMLKRAEAYPDRLSGGEQQRVAVVRALVHRPGLVLADEPTGSLDPTAGEAVIDLLEELVREDGGTLMLVTHSRRLARRADRVLQISGGCLIQADEADGIRDAPKSTGGSEPVA